MDKLYWIAAYKNVLLENTDIKPHCCQSLANMAAQYEERTYGLNVLEWREPKALAHSDIDIKSAWN